MKQTLADWDECIARPWNWVRRLVVGRARRAREESGQSLVELGLVLPLLLLLTLGVIDLGMGFKTYITLTNAAREGVRWVTIYPSDPAGGVARAIGEAQRVGLEQGDLGSGGIHVFFTPPKSKYSAGEEVTAHVQYEYELLFGQITHLPPISFEATATMVVLYDE
jgi:hypothetical protein